MPYIEETISSVKNQDYQCFEHIVYDGISNDGTQKVLKKYPHLKWFSESDNGQSEAINKGFKIAKGEIIGWLNSDDTYQPGAFKNVVEYFENNPEVDLIHTDLNIINENSEVIGFTEGGDFDVIRLFGTNMIKQPTVFMRKRVIDKLISVNEKLHYVMDRELWLRAGLADIKFVYLPNEVFANFRLIRGTKSFESGHEFNIEWHSVIQGALKNKYFDNLSIKKKSKILHVSQTKIYISELRECSKKGQRLNVAKIFLKAISETPGSITQFGIWKLLFYGLLGI